jgi:hypothetical protein
MENEAARLRRKIALYREYLRGGVEAPLAQIYLEEIAGAESALAEIERMRRGDEGS